MVLRVAGCYKNGVVARYGAHDLRPFTAVEVQGDALRRASRGADDGQVLAGGQHVANEVGRQFCVGRGSGCGTIRP